MTNQLRKEPHFRVCWRAMIELMYSRK